MGPTAYYDDSGINEDVDRFKLTYRIDYRMQDRRLAWRVRPAMAAVAVAANLDAHFANIR